MIGQVSRRGLMGGALALPFFPRIALASAEDLLERLRAAKSATVGVANFPPYSALEPDGTVTGLVPDIAKTILARLGVPQIKGVVATYGELIPGLQAGRWDFIGAALTITEARCAQVVFSDPMLFDGPCFVSLKGALPDGPKTVKELVARKLTIGVSSGGAIGREALKAGVSPGDIRQLPDNVALINALQAKRIDLVFQDHAGIERVFKQRGLPVDVVFPISDAPEHGSGCAFRRGDAGFVAAFQKELRAMKASGEFLATLRKYGFDMTADQLRITGDQACTLGG